MTLEEPVARLEGIIEAIQRRLDSIEARLDARFNSLTTIVVAMWVTTMLAVLSTLVTVLLRT